jgi:hypothetical protein
MTDENSTLYTEEEVSQIARNYAEKQASAQHFFLEVMRSEDTTKVGFLTDTELGLPKLPIRTYKELALFVDTAGAGDIKLWKDYFNGMSEIQTSTSLSRNAKLLSLVGTQRKEVADMTPQKKENKGWFRKKDDNSQQQ